MRDLMNSDPEPDYWWNYVGSLAGSLLIVMI